MEEHLVFISHSSEDALVAQLICHRLEEAGIRCWIAPRDIKHADWANEIMEALARSDIFVIIVGEHSIESPECTKEITQATHICKYIIPFKIDQADLSATMTYHLGPAHWLDASTPPMEKRVAELLDRIQNLTDADVVYLNTRRYKLKENISWPRPHFFGRDAEMEEIAQRLPEEKVLFLQGMGGIGKSEIAKNYAKKYHDRYDTVIFLAYDGSIIDLVTGDALTIENLPPQDTSSEDLDAFFQRKMEAFRHICSERTLLILDNYDVDYDPHFADLANTSCHLLVTTRNDHFEYETLIIGPIGDQDALRELFVNARGKKISPEDMEYVDEMIRLVGGHTITIELIARQMAVSRSQSKPKDMLALLRESGVNTGLKETFQREGENSRNSAFGFIEKLFVLSDLSEECLRLLRYMCLVPYTGIDICLFHDICGLDSYDDLNELIAHSWLMLNEDTDVMNMHPVVYDVVKEQLHPDVHNAKEYIAGLWRKVGSLWVYSREDRTRLWPLYYELIQNYYDPIPELWKEFGYLENNAWICGRYALSIELGHRFLAYTKENFPDDFSKIGIAATYLGGCYHNSGDDAKAAPFYEEGLENQKKSISPESDYTAWDELSSAYQKVGRWAYLTDDFEKSKSCFDESIRISLEHCDGKGSYGNALLETGCMYIRMGEYENALPYLEKSNAVYAARSGPENPNSACALKDIGKCLTNLGNYEKARTVLEESLAMHLQFNGIDSRQTFWAKEALADLAMAEGNREEGLRLYQELEVEMAQAFGEQNADLEALRKKIQSKM